MKQAFSFQGSLLRYYLELVAGAGGEVVDLDLAGAGRVHRELDPVWHPRVLLPVPDECLE